jgi:hypothetical protein
MQDAAAAAAHAKDKLMQREEKLEVKERVSYHTLCILPGYVPNFSVYFFLFLRSFL